MTKNHSTFVEPKREHLLAHTRAKTAKGKRFLENRESKTVEDVKICMFLHSISCSSVAKEVMADLYRLKKPDGIMFNKKNKLHPFEGGESESSLEFYSRKNDASFCCLASHNKKRPHCLTFTRFFNHQVLDMFELSVTNFVSIREAGGAKCAVGLKPAFVFSGGDFETNPDLKQIQNYFLDLFRGHVVDSVNLAGLESVISITAHQNQILFRVYHITAEKSSEEDKVNVSLSLMGPSIDFSVGRVRAAAADVMKEALRVPKEIKATKLKNVSTTALGEKLGRVHVGDQKLDKIQTRKLKGLKASNDISPSSSEDDAEAQEDSGEESE